MGGLLVEHAIANIWCEPIQDRQYRTALARLSKNAVSKFVNVLWERIELPLVSGYARPLWHVYQVGALPASLFDITLPVGQWTAVSSLVVTDAVVVDIFFINGCKIPLDTCYLYQCVDGNLILAVQYLPRINYLGQDIDRDTLYIRFYANALYDTAAWRSIGLLSSAPLQVVNRYIVTESDYTAFMVGVNQINTTYTLGYGTYYIDGYVVNPLLGFDPVYLGRQLSFIWDSSVKHTQEFTVASLPLFTSSIDPNIVKYLAVMDRIYDTIDYHDDIDIYLFNSAIGAGVYVSRLRAETCRQVTHSAYSVSKRVIDDLRTSLGWTNAAVLSIRFVIRQGGLNRGLSQQASRIEELYKLSYLQIIEAMTTVTPVPEWSARALEESSYTQLMASDIEDIDLAVASVAYGYNASTRIIADPVLRIDANALPIIRLPELLTTRDLDTNDGLRVLYYYADGTYLGYANDNSVYRDYYIPPAYAAADTVEAFNANALVRQTGALYDQNVESHRLAQYGFRCYACAIVGGQPSEVWYDVTDTPYYYYDSVGTSGNGYTPSLVWDYGLLSAANLFPCVRIGDVHYTYTAPALTPSYLGYIQFPLQEDVVWFGTPTTRPFKLPIGVIDVFMDGLSLIRQLDYYIHAGIVTITKRPDSDPADTVIQVRAYGFPDPQTLLADLPRESDFVRAGMLSVNGYYNIRNDRNIRIVVSGRLTHRTDVRFTETMSGALTTDGRPYAISDYAVAVENFTNQRTLPFRQQAIELDNRVMDYLTTRLPEPATPTGVIMVERWELFSPFCSAVLHALLDGFLSAGQLDMAYTDAQVDGWLASYYPLLAVDPCVQPIDLRYVVIYPHQYRTVVSVTHAQYTFLEYLIGRFLNNRTDLTPAVFIE